MVFFRRSLQGKYIYFLASLPMKYFFLKNFILMFILITYLI
ncbi:K+-transporting ATPase, F subunit [Tolypothrix sp. PCC 7601]|nr:K+-transporting ATPase, F subunit [Tolypothrix sp. PCC 7601]